ncbi:MAG TPA: PSD1 and planctomycete cytochrome C domain-containing protein [Blastocatellia bacterium]|nr:PSD1 and planctomycete cytochrome C domain-containing protein [Blastocatellia bacterium]
MKRTLQTCACGVFLVALACAALSLPPRGGPVSQAQAVDFARDIRPLFEQHCADCHGEKRAMGQLRLDSKTAALKGGVSGAVIVPGNGRESRLIKRITGDGDGPRMPRGRAPLTPPQIALITRWIDEGAAWPEAAGDSAAPNAQPAISKHWAYVKPARPEPPTVAGAAWVRNAIDRFILARLEREGLKPSPEADKTTLARRLYLDLTGLPPSVKEVDEFVADQSPQAYDNLVDRLLASPHYGERWARPWLDLARYADSNGYEKDRPRVMWKYRDWVINAFNRDMAFDQFTVEQLAGDMLPNATADQKIATGFHRNTLLNQEGGIDVEEARWETLLDRVNTTATVWLGATLGCAQCHNHKYDPYTQKDYYRFLAFFDNAEYAVGGDGDHWIAEPELDLPTPEQEAKRKEVQADLYKLQLQLNADTPETTAAQREWESSMLAERDRWAALDPIAFKSANGATFTKLEDKSLLVSGDNPEFDTQTVTARSDVKGITGLRLEALPDARLPQGGPGRDPYGNFLLTGVEIEAAPADNPAAAQPVEYKAAGVDDAASYFAAAYLSQKPTREAVVDQPKGWAIDATRDATRLARQLVIKFDKPVSFDSGTVFTVKLKYLAGGIGQAIGRFRLSASSTDDPLRVTRLSAKVRPLLEVAPGDRGEQQKKDIAAQFRATAPALKALRDQIGERRAALRKLGIVTALVMQERAGFERPSTFLRVRGGYLNRGEKVYAATPAVLHAWPEDQPFNRLGLARWLVDENNPLTARVTVNRLWEQLFGRGIVETSEDFGTQGTPPAHAELLDWLATELVRQKWSQKAIIRLMVTSATYRQSSAVTPELRERDPYNRWLARGPRFRLEAEMIRDAALAISGLLSRKVGGPSVFPPQPEGVWRNPYSDERWVTSQGEDRYRRGLYTFIRRTSPYPAFMTFDATSREVCTVRRVRTNTPLQALTTLNDEAFFEMARALAKRMLTEAGSDVKARAVYGFRLCVSRQPLAEEVERLVKFYNQQLSYYGRHAAEAERVTKGVTAGGASAAELAAWTMTANALLNLDETLTKE